MNVLNNECLALLGNVCNFTRTHVLMYSTIYNIRRKAIQIPIVHETHRKQIYLRSPV